MLILDDADKRVLATIGVLLAAMGVGVLSIAVVVAVAVRLFLYLSGL